MRGRTCVQSRPPQVAAQGWYGDGAHVSLADRFYKGDQARIDVLHTALVAPVALGREIDDVSRIVEPEPLEHEHADAEEQVGFALAGPPRP
jgi:hypothetical protein